MSEWNTNMDEAPRDGTDILVWLARPDTSGGIFRIVNWDRSLGKYRANIHSFVPFDSFTAWMPLPPPPEDAA